MTTTENALRELMDAILVLRPELEKVDITKSIDDNVHLTGTDERIVKAYLMGMKATK